MEKQTIKNHINKSLTSINTRYHPEIPLSAIFGIVKCYSGKIVDEDGTEWDGLLLGDNSHASFRIDGFRFTLSLYLSWYKMPSGNYEITAYVS